MYSNNLATLLKLIVVQYERREREPLVSIVTPAYNASRFITEAIKSVRAQTHANWEMIVVDDCSGDNTRELVRESAEEDGRIRLVLLESNSGPAAARNVALEEARGRYVAFLDSDDMWLPTKLAEQISFMRARDAAFSYTAYSKIGPDGNKLGRSVTVPERMTYDALLKNTVIGCLTVMIDHSKTGPLRMGSEKVKRGEDYVLWFKLLKSGFVPYGLQKDLARYRIVEGSMSRNKLKAAHRMWKLYRKVEHLSLPYSAWCFLNYASHAYLKSRR